MLTIEKAEELYKISQDEYAEQLKKGLNLNMSRGIPCAQQLDLALGVLEALHARGEFANSTGDDPRNYGVWNGIKEMRDIFSDMINVPADLIVLGNNSSLQMMFDCMSMGVTHGFNDCEPWCKQGNAKFLCPSPGYDRHFAITEYFGIEMIPVPIKEDGPDMDMIEKLVAEDESIKGCWCVPKYSNPTGITYSDETVRRFANLKPAAKDFKIFWDNAYSVHTLRETDVKLLSLYDECIKAGTEDHVIIFASTSKISFPGAGVAGLGTGPATHEEIRKRICTQTIGSDKLNQLRHVLFLHDIDGVKNLMQEHRKIIEPKFRLVTDLLEKGVGELDIATWNNPIGGYFINLNVMNGTAKRVIELCKEAGIVLTSAGATFPYGKDPEDKNIRIAPTFPPIDELKQAIEVLITSIKLAACEKTLNK